MLVISSNTALSCQKKKCKRNVEPAREALSVVNVLHTSKFYEKEKKKNFFARTGLYRVKDCYCLGKS